MAEASLFRNGQYWKPLCIGLFSLLAVLSAAWVGTTNTAATHVTRPEMVQRIDRELKPIVKAVNEIKDDQRTFISDVQDMAVELGRISEKLNIPKEE